MEQTFKNKRIELNQKNKFNKLSSNMKEMIIEFLKPKEQFIIFNLTKKTRNNFQKRKLAKIYSRFKSKKRYLCSGTNHCIKNCVNRKKNIHTYNCNYDLDLECLNRRLSYKKKKCFKCLKFFCQMCVDDNLRGCINTFCIKQTFCLYCMKKYGTSLVTCGHKEHLLSIKKNKKVYLPTNGFCETCFYGKTKCIYCNTYGCHKYCDVNINCSEHVWKGIFDVVSGGCVYL